MIRMPKNDIAPTSLPLRSTVVWQNKHTDVTIWPAHKRATALIVFISGNPGSFEDPGDTVVKRSHTGNTCAMDLTIRDCLCRASWILRYVSIFYTCDRTSILGDHRSRPRRPIARPPTHSFRSASNIKKPPTNIARSNRQQDRFLRQTTSSVQSRCQSHFDRSLGWSVHMQGNYEEKARYDRWHVWIVSITCTYCSNAEWPKVSILAHVFRYNTDIASLFRLSPLFRDPVRVALTSFVYVLNALLPFMVVRFFVRKITSQRKPADYTTARLVTSPGVVSAAVNMGADEMRTIKDMDNDCQYPQHRKALCTH